MFHKNTKISSYFVGFSGKHFLKYSPPLQRGHVLVRTPPFCIFAVEKPKDCRTYRRNASENGAKGANIKIFAFWQQSLTKNSMKSKYLEIASSKNLRSYPEEFVNETAIKSKNMGSIRGFSALETP